MCTAIDMRKGRHLFGRTLDLEKSYGEEIVITPSGFLFEDFKTKYSIIGTAMVQNGIPLYFDGMNEAGLCAAALNYPHFAFYGKEIPSAVNMPSYALLHRVLGICSTVDEAEKMLSEVNVTDVSFSPQLPSTPLHWIVVDGKRSLIAEPNDGLLSLYDNDVGVMTNSPPFPYQRIRLCDYLGLTADPPTNKICPSADIFSYSRGLGSIGLPGDHSSSSRFIRAVFTSQNTVSTSTPISDFFHIADSVSIPSGTVIAENGSPVRTVYTCCADPSSLTYYFTTYDCRRIRGVRLRPDTDDRLVCFKMSKKEDIETLNM